MFCCIMSFSPLNSSVVVLLFVVNIRNLALEKVAEQVEFPCRFAGCTAVMMAADKMQHEKLCEFRFVSNVAFYSVL